jgi:hypothetical protein
MRSQGRRISASLDYRFLTDFRAGVAEDGRYGLAFAAGQGLSDGTGDVDDGRETFFAQENDRGLLIGNVALTSRPSGSLVIETVVMHRMRRIANK